MHDARYRVSGEETKDIIQLDSTCILSSCIIVVNVKIRSSIFEKQLKMYVIKFLRNLALFYVEIARSLDLYLSTDKSYWYFN